LSLWRDIGGGVEMQRCDCARGPSCVVLIKHQHDGTLCMAGYAPLAVPCRAGEHENFWGVDQDEPLTLSPSLSFPCGLHGFIREGRWVGA
jgi:hypothetical protein